MLIHLIFPYLCALLYLVKVIFDKIKAQIIDNHFINSIRFLKFYRVEYKSLTKREARIISHSNPIHHFRFLIQENEV